VKRALTACLALGIAASALGGCAASKPLDYGPYLDHMPRSILVLPPLNESPAVDAPYGLLSTVTSPIAERGYYVFPVAVVDQMMKENGCPTSGEMHQVPIDRLRAVFGADAVLYLTVKQWGTKYQVISSNTTVAVVGRLVDTRTGTELWSGSGLAVRDSSSGQNSLAAMLVAAVVNQVASSMVDYSHDIAPIASAALVGADTDRGMLAGSRSPAYEEDQRRHAELRAAATR